MKANVHVLRYLWEVRCALTGSRKKKKKLLTIVEASVREFASETPDLNYGMLVERFGVPQKIAESSVTEMEPCELLKSMQVRQKILRVALMVIALVLTLRLVCLVVAYVSYAKDLQGYAVVEIIEVEDVIYEEGEKE